MTVGMTNKERMQKAQGLATMIGKIEQWLAQGLEDELVTKSQLYKASKDWIEASAITQFPDEYLVNPDSQWLRYLSNPQELYKPNSFDQSGLT